MGAYGCESCGRVMIAEAVIDDTDNHGTAFQRLEHTPTDQIKWHPRRGHRREFHDVPLHIAEAASEAYQCHSVDCHRAAVALTRAVIEATAKERGISKPSLYAMIEQMRDDGLIRSSTCEEAHEIRHWGNGMAHGDFVGVVSSVQAEGILELMSEVLQEVYQNPARLTRIKAARLSGNP